jgi:hypothetical protein
MRWTLSIALLAAATSSGAVARPDPTHIAPGWMAGCWEQVSGEKWTEECWMGPRGGIMLGAGRSGAGAALHEWEATQILAGTDGEIAFWASPDGGARVGFPMVSQGPKEIVFANPAHDYPQRIRYWLDGETLNAEISLMDGSKTMRWSYRRTQ